MYDKPGEDFVRNWHTSKVNGFSFVHEGIKLIYLHPVIGNIQRFLGVVVHEYLHHRVKAKGIMYVENFLIRVKFGFFSESEHGPKFHEQVEVVQNSVLDEFINHTLCGGLEEKCKECTTPKVEKKGWNLNPLTWFNL